MWGEDLFTLSYLVLCQIVEKFQHLCPPQKISQITVLKTTICYLTCAQKQQNTYAETWKISANNSITIVNFTHSYNANMQSIFFDQMKVAEQITSSFLKEMLRKFDSHNNQELQDIIWIKSDQLCYSCSPFNLFAIINPFPDANAFSDPYVEDN